MEFPSFNAFTPDEIVKRVENASVVKGSRDFLTTFFLAILAGAFIAFGAAFYTVVTHDSELSYGLTKLVGGFVFCIGLILVVVAGAELFTGNNLLVMAWADRKISLKQLFNNWTVVYIGNLIGSLFVVYLVYSSGHWEMNAGNVGKKAVMIALAKTERSGIELFFSGILCNILVCLAVWLSFAGRSVVDKILSILFPITAFVAMGFEHSVANMYFIPAGMLAGKGPDITGFISNLVPVTLGNIVGGGLLVALVYWFIYLYPQKRKTKN
jgi:formate/nitrite transporter